MPEHAATVAVVGGGPAGLMAAETLLSAGLRVDLYEAKGSVGRKFLIAGKGGLNLTHSEPFEPFASRFRERSEEVRRWLHEFDATAVREWARGLGIETFVGSSGRVFPVDLKAAPLLRAWVRRLREGGVRFHVHHRWLGFDDRRRLRFRGMDGDVLREADAVVLALGGASWPQLGSDGAWVPWLAGLGVEIAPLQASNCGFDAGWSGHFATRHAGAPIKPVAIAWTDAAGRSRRLQGECVATATGLEGSLVYALSAELRDAITREGHADIVLDLAPGRGREWLQSALDRPRNRRSIGEHLRRATGIEGVKAGLLHECLAKADFEDPARLAAAIKALPLRLLAPRPLAEAISTAGGVRFEAMDGNLMLAALPGVFCAGEMLDWEAPTGGYLLTASLASGRAAALGATRWLGARP